MTYSIDDMRDAEWDYENEPDQEIEIPKLSLAGESHAVVEGDAINRFTRGGLFLDHVLPTEEADS